MCLARGRADALRCGRSKLASKYSLTTLPVCEGMLHCAIRTFLLPSTTISHTRARCSRSFPNTHKRHASAAHCPAGAVQSRAGVLQASLFRYTPQNGVSGFCHQLGFAARISRHRDVLVTVFPPVIGRASGSSLPVSSLVLLLSPNVPSYASRPRHPFHFVNPHRSSRPPPSKIPQPLPDWR